MPVPSLLFLAIAYVCLQSGANLLPESGSAGWWSGVEGPVARYGALKIARRLRYFVLTQGLQWVLGWRCGGGRLRVRCAVCEEERGDDGEQQDAGGPAKYRDKRREVSG